MILDRINEIIKEQQGKALNEENLLTDSEMDSFSYAFFWAYINDEYPEFNNDYVNTINYETYTIKEMINHHENSKL